MVCPLMIFQIFAYLILLPSYFKYTLPHPRLDPPILDLVKYLKNSVLRSFVKLANPIDCNNITCWIQVATVLKATEVIYSRLDNEWQRRLEIKIPKWGFAEIGGLHRYFTILGIICMVWDFQGHYSTYYCNLLAEVMRQSGIVLTEKERQEIG